jgi:cysteinyl-tRNA synthetase
MGGIDNLIRHHDYIIAVLESVRPYPVARYWLHCYHLYVNGKKMSKSTGNIVYTSDIMDRGFTLQELRFFLIYGHYRKRLNYTEKTMAAAASLLKDTKSLVKKLKTLEGSGFEVNKNQPKTGKGDGFAQKLEKAFETGLKNDLNLREGFDGLRDILLKAANSNPARQEAIEIMKSLRKIDGVMGVLF